MCRIRAPNGTGDALRDGGWNMDKYPELTPEDKYELEPFQGAWEDIYYMEWEDVMDHFETMYATLYSSPSTLSPPVSHDGRGLFKVHITDTETPFVINIDQHFHNGG